MEGLDWLCKCCMNANCLKNKIKIKEENECKIIQCCDYIKDNNKIKPYIKIDYKIRSEEL